MHAHRAVLNILAVAAGLVLADTAAACSISIGTAGTLKVDNADPRTMSSAIGVPTPATVTSVLPVLEGVTFEVGVPTMGTAPAGYSYGTGSQQVAYTASVVGLLQIKDQPFTTSPTSFSTGVLGALTVTIVLHNRITNSAGFPSGSYSTRTLITCHP